MVLLPNEMMRLLAEAPTVLWVMAEPERLISELAVEIIDSILKEYTNFGSGIRMLKN
jgi:hypothetical protein